MGAHSIFNRLFRYAILFPFALFGNVHGEELIEQNEPPTITHIPVVASVEGKPIQVGATIVDTSGIVQKATVFFSQSTTAVPIGIPMKGAAGGAFVGTIPGQSTMGKNQLWYFIQAEDSFGDKGETAWYPVQIKGIDRDQGEENNSSESSQNQPEQLDEPVSKSTKAATSTKTATAAKSSLLTSKAAWIAGGVVLVGGGVAAASGGGGSSGGGGDSSVPVASTGGGGGFSGNAAIFRLDPTIRQGVDIHVGVCGEDEGDELRAAGSWGASVSHVSTSSDLHNMCCSANEMMLPRPPEEDMGTIPADGTYSISVFVNGRKITQIPYPQSGVDAICP